MGIYERLLGLEDPKIPVHAFYSMVTERRRARVTQQQVIDAFGLSAGEQTELTTLVNRIAANKITGPEVHEVLMLAESALAPYTTVAAVKTRFGV